MKPLNKTKKGVVLIMTIGFLFIISLLGIGFIYMIKTEEKSSLRYENRAKAYYLAFAGIEAGLSLLKDDTNNYDSENEPWHIGAPISKMNEFYKNKIAGYDITPIYHAGKITQGIIDENRKIKFCKENAELISKYLELNKEAVLKLIEIGDISNFEPSKKEYLTLYGNGKININTAPYEVILSLPNMNEKIANSIIAKRRGEDQIDGTLDDKPYIDISELMGIPDMNDVIYNSIAPYLTTKSETFTIISVGNAPLDKEFDIVYRIIAVIDRGGKNIKKLSWLETDGIQKKI